MVFPEAPHFSTNYQWVRDVAQKVGMPYEGVASLNLPRHPSQLYEALFEGVVLFLFLWFVIRPNKKRHPSGFVFGWYLIGYGAIRFILEYFRAPDANLGYLIKGGPGSDNIALFQSFLNISLGQILCFLMIVGGVLLLVIRKKESS
jgi:phosphatidylglycerol:prolipoprotein diacylglycerol transferase